MKPVTLTNEQARTFVLRKHGLIGPYRFSGKEGVLAYVRQCGCIQYDPVNLCGKNTELVMQSRVEGFRRPMLDVLLYEDRSLVDYFDKNLAIIPVEDWPCFARDRAQHHEGGRSQGEVEKAAEAVREILKARECISSADLDMNEKVSWYWSDTRLSRAVLETLYFRGELCVHHKRGTIKHYAPADRLLPSEILGAPDPYPEDGAHRDWRILRRIGAVGLLWARPSDAYLGVPGLKNGGLAEGVRNLVAAEKVVAVQVDGIKETLYARMEDLPLLDEVRSGVTYEPRMELIAPLDCFLWDRKLIRQLFDFAYTWEIYTPQEKRQYGAYVLPVVRGNALVGRVEAVADRKAGVLQVKNIWWEGRAYKGEIRKCLKRFAKFNDCAIVEGI